MTVRIKDLTAALAIASDDKMVIDGATNGARSISIIDDDTMATASGVNVATAESIVAYVGSATIDGENQIIKLRADTAANLTSANETYGAGEIVLETDTGNVYRGDGATAHTGLTAVIAPGGNISVSDTFADITSATTLSTSNVNLATSGSALTVRRLKVNLGAPARIDVGKSLAANTHFVLEILATSSQVTLGIEDDEAGSSIAEGKTAGQTLAPISGSTVDITVLSNAGTAPICRTIGNFDGEAVEIAGALTVTDDLTVTGDLIAPATVQVECVAASTEVTTGDGKAYFVIPADFNGWNLVGVEASNVTAAATGSGVETTDIQIHNLTQTADMLTTKLTIDEDEFYSGTAATAAVIDTANDDVASGDVIRIDVDAVPSTTGGNGLMVILKFQLP